MTGANGQMVELLSIAGRQVEVDTEIAPLVVALNAAGLETAASCSGHGHRPATIALADGREVIIARDFAEARKIDRLFPTDINGETTRRCEPVEQPGEDEWSEWFHPQPGYLMECCDCGLIHEMQFAVGTWDGEGPLNPGESDETGVVIFRARRTLWAG